MASRLLVTGNPAWLRSKRGRADITLFNKREATNDLIADIANDLVFAVGRYSRVITLNPPSGYAAYPILASAVAGGSDSIFTYLTGVAPKDLDQAVPPTTYTGGTITWELSGGNMTGRIASVTGGGDGIISISYWRESTRATSTIVATMQGGVIVSAFTVTSASLNTQQTIESPTLTGATVSLTVDSLSQVNALASPTLTQTNNLTPNALAQTQTIENDTFTSSATYARSITLNPPAGQTARPVQASVANTGSAFSFFSLLGFAPSDGDQAVTPDTWDDSGTPRAIAWAVDGSGHPTGVVTSVANGPASINVYYWRQSTGTWSTLSMTVASPVTLTVNGVTTSAALAQSAAIPLGFLAPANLTTVQTTEIGQVATGGGAPVKYTRSFTLLPPAGRTAYPISAATINLSSESVFQFLVGSPVTGDQASAPVSYVDGGGTTRAITWELDSSGNMTGRIAEIDGAAATTITIPYWDSTTGTWYTITVPLQDYTGGLVAQNVSTVQTVAVPTVGVQRTVTPNPINNQQIIFPANLALQYTVLPISITQLQALALAGVSTLGSLGSFPIISTQFFEQPAITQLGDLTVAPISQVQALQVGSLDYRFTIESSGIATVQTLGAGIAAPVGVVAPSTIFNTQLLGNSALVVGGSLSPFRIDSRQTIDEVVLNMPANGSISAKLTIFPVFYGNISLRSS